MTLISHSTLFWTEIQHRRTSPVVHRKDARRQLRAKLIIKERRIFSNECGAKAHDRRKADS
jgi:hypothetical protein